MGYNPYPYAATIKPYPEQLIGPTDVTPLITLIDALPRGVIVAVDTETTGLDVYQADEIRGVSLCWRTFNKYHSFYIPVNYPSNPIDKAQIQRIFRALKSRDPFYILHHGKFDFAFLRQLPVDTDGSVFFGFPDADKWWDTKVVAWLMDENSKTGLKDQAAHHFGIESKAEQTEVKKLIKLRGGWGKLTPEDTAAYGAKDAELTYRLAEVQADLISSSHPTVFGNPGADIVREFDIQATLYRLEQTGILVDEAALDALTEQTAKRIAEIEATFTFNLKSPIQVGKWLHEAGALPEGHPRTPSGNPSMARADLERLDESGHEHSGLKLVLEHRRLQKAMSGYLVPLKARIGRDGRVHPGFMSTGTVTGRFSCSRPNLQTIPRSDTLPGVRELFIAEPGFELWEYDLSAAEMRVVAGMAGETSLIEALENGVDMHGRLAEQVFGPNYTGLQRRYAKNIGYGWFYGLTSTKTAAKYIAGPNAEKIAGEILAGLKVLYPKVYKLMGRTTREAQKHGYVKIHDSAWPGRFRRFNGERRSPCYTALNAKVQGGIGELMKDVMLVAEGELAKTHGRICLQVHDSLVCEVLIGHGPSTRNTLQAILNDVNPFEMPMKFDAAPWSAHE